jgi:hypothetical protein
MRTSGKRFEGEEYSGSDGERKHDYRNKREKTKFL